MNDQSQMMKSQAPPPPPQLIGQSSSQMMNQPLQQPLPQMMMNRNFGLWPQPPPPQINPSMDQHPINQFQNNPFNASSKQRSNWKGKKDNNKRNNNNNDLIIRNNMPNKNIIIGTSVSGGVGGGGYKPPTLSELQNQNRMKAKKFYHPKKKFNNRFAPYAPRNTTSFIIRAKKSGGITSLVSPCPVTPAVLPTPIFSPSREVLGDTAKEEWGVDGYGSMKGLIRLRSPGNEVEDDDDDEGGGSSESDVEEHVEVERRLDHDLSRFEMIYPNNGGGGFDYSNNNVFLENRVDDQDTHIAQLEEENLTLKERLFLMEREMGDLRRRLLSLERRSGVMVDINEEVVENVSDNDTESSEKLGGEYNNEMVQYVAGSGRGRVVDGKENNEEVAEYDERKYVDVKEDNDRTSDKKVTGDVCMEEFNINPMQESEAKYEAKDVNVKDKADTEPIEKKVAEDVHMEDSAVARSEEQISEQVSNAEEVQSDSAQVEVQNARPQEANNEEAGSTN